MRWWQLYFSLNDAKKLNQPPELLLLASYFIDNLWLYPFEERKKLWDKGIQQAIAKINKLSKYVKTATQELVYFYERVGIKGENKTTGDTTSTLETIHALLLFIYKEPERVWNLRLHEIAEIVRGIKIVVKVIGGKNEKTRS